MERPRRAEVPPPPESREQHEVIRRTVEYKDSEGNVLGHAEIELGTDEVEVDFDTLEGEQGTARELLSFVIHGEKEGKPVSLDMLALANTHDASILVADDHLKNYSYSDSKRRALVPPLETALDVGVFLHELGHAAQHHEERFKDISPLYGKEKKMRDGKVSYAALKTILDAVVAAVPEVGPIMDDEGLEQLDRLDGERVEALKNKRAIEKKLDKADVKESSILRHAVTDALTKGPVGTFEERAVEVDEDIQDHRGDEAYAEQKRETLLALLEDAGFSFAVSETIDVEIDVEWPENLPELPRDTVLRDIRVMSALYQFARDGLTTTNAAYETDPDNGRLFVVFECDTIPELKGWRVKIDVPVSDEVPAALMEAQEEVRTLEKEADAYLAEADAAERRQTSLIRVLNVGDIAATPTRMLERDATRRAYQWLRKIRQEARVDFLAPHLVDPGTTIEGKQKGPCVESVGSQLTSGEEPREIEITVRDDLRRALGTYKADRFRLKRPDDEDDIGITPIAGGRRGV